MRFARGKNRPKVLCSPSQSERSGAGVATPTPTSTGGFAGTFLRINSLAEEESRDESDRPVHHPRSTRGVRARGPATAAAAPSAVLAGCGYGRAGSTSGFAERWFAGDEGGNGRWLSRARIGAGRLGAGHLLRLEHQRRPADQGQQRLHYACAAGRSHRGPQVHRRGPRRRHAQCTQGPGGAGRHAVGGRHRHAARVQRAHWCSDR